MKDFLLGFKRQIIGCVYALFVYLEISVDVVKCLFWLIVVDTLTGIIKSIVLSLDITFNKLFKGMISKIVFLCIPVTLALMGKGLGYEYGIFIKLVMDLLLISEAISIFGNILSVRTKVEVKNYDAITMIIKSIRNFCIKIFEGLIKNINTEK